MSKLVNAYTVAPNDIEEGDVMLFVVKAMVTRRDNNRKLYYRLYRCAYDGDIPQETRLFQGAKMVCEALFPSLALVGISED